MKNTLMILLPLCLLMQSVISVMAGRGGDTVIVGESQNSFRIDRESPNVVLPLAIEYKNLAACKSLYLCFVDILLEKPPEGNYEVYLVDSLPRSGAME